MKIKTITQLFVLAMYGLLMLGFNSCKKDEIASDTPSCIIEKIKEFKNYACSDGKVDEYIFQEKTVYVFDQGSTCGFDLTSDVVDEECNSLGFLGGFAGNTTINGESFSNAEFIRNIWKM